MSALLYLVRHQLRNQLLELLHHPGKLILYLFIVLMVGVSIFTGGGRNPDGPSIGFGFLPGGYFAVLLILMMMVLWSGVKSGSTFFTMPDVNFLFVSPLSSKLILGYGLVKQISSLLFLMLFLLCYTPTLTAHFPIGVGGVLLLIVGAAVVLLLAQAFSMLIYSFTNGNPGRIRAAKTALGIFAAIPVAMFLKNFMALGYSPDAAAAAGSASALQMFPVVGWVKGAVFACLSADFASAAGYAALTTGLLALSIFLLIRSNADYYEDVLQSTETMYQAKQQVKENNGYGDKRFFSQRKVRVTRTGLGHGWGADTFFYRQMCEIRRRSRFGLFGGSTLASLLAALGGAFFLNKSFASEGNPLSPDLLLAIILGIELYLMVLFFPASDWMAELRKPYIFLVPEKPFAKLVWACLPTILRPAADGLIAFAAAGIFLRAGVPITAACIVTFAGFSVLFTAAGVLFQRLFNQSPTRGLMMFAYLFTVGILMLPGLIAALTAVNGMQWPLSAAGIPMTVLNLLVSAGLIYACRNLLEVVEFHS